MEFGDTASGIFNTSVAATPAHTFNAPGFYTVWLKITDPHGCTDSTSFVVHAVGPVASFTSPDTTGCRPFSTTFNSTSTIEGAAIVQYYWNFDYPGFTELDTTGSGSRHTHISNSGKYSVNLSRRWKWMSRFSSEHSIHQCQHSLFQFSRQIHLSATVRSIIAVNVLGPCNQSIMNGHLVMELLQ